MTDHNPTHHDLGYYFAPPQHPGDPGSPRLEINLLPEPSGRHFDPEQVEAPAITPYQGFEMLRVNHPWDGPKQVRIVAGQVNIEDRKHAIVDAFTFGGTMEIESTPERTTCVITSPAPILDLSVPGSTGFLLAQEVEILLAQRRAAWAHDLDTYEHRLSNVEPLALFHACLDALRERFSHFMDQTGAEHQRFVHFLREESRAVHSAHRLPEGGRPLDELL